MRGIGNYGLLRADSAHNVIGVKRAFAAVRNVVTVFDSSLVRVPRRVSSPENSLQLWEFQRKGAPLFVFWTTGEWVHENGTWRMTYRRPGDGMETRPAVFNWPGPPLEEPVWVDLLTGGVFSFPKDRMKECADGLVFTDVPVYDSPCLITERRKPTGTVPINLPRRRQRKHTLEKSKTNVGNLKPLELATFCLTKRLALTRRDTETGLPPGTERHESGLLRITSDNRLERFVSRLPVQRDVRDSPRMSKTVGDSPRMSTEHTETPLAARKAHGRIVSAKRTVHTLRINAFSLFPVVF